jgi:hypothetical protein
MAVVALCHCTTLMAAAVPVYRSPSASATEPSSKAGVGRTLVAARALTAGDAVVMYGGPSQAVLPAPTMHTVEIREGVHAVPTGGSELVSHSCEPNTDLVPVKPSAHEEGTWERTDNHAQVEAILLVTNQAVAKGECSFSTGTEFSFSRNPQGKKSRSTIRSTSGGWQRPLTARVARVPAAGASQVLPPRRTRPRTSSSGRPPLSCTTRQSRPPSPPSDRRCILSKVTTPILCLK